MARARSIASVVLSLATATSLALPAQAAPHARLPIADLAAPAASSNPPAPQPAPVSNPRTAREAAPATRPGLPFAPTGWPWMQPRVRMQYDPTPLSPHDPNSAPTTPFLVVRTTSGRPLELAITPPDEPLPRPRPRRIVPFIPLIAGVVTFTATYAITGFAAEDLWRDCDLDSQGACRRRAAAMMIPIAGPIRAANQTRQPEYYALAAFQGAGLALIVIGAIATWHARHRRRVLAERGLHIAKNTALGLDGGPTGGQLTVHHRF